MRESGTHAWESLQQEEPPRCKPFRLSIESTQNRLLPPEHLIGQEP